MAPEEVVATLESLCPLWRRISGGFRVFSNLQLYPPYPKGCDPNLVIFGEGETLSSAVAAFRKAWDFRPRYPGEIGLEAYRENCKRNLHASPTQPHKNHAPTLTLSDLGL